ncbi:MAG: hypothetical protein AAGF56_03425 [Pseudomonadota bacterium]
MGHDSADSLRTQSFFDSPKGIIGATCLNQNKLIVVETDLNKPRPVKRTVFKTML